MSAFKCCTYVTALAAALVFVAPPLPAQSTNQAKSAEKKAIVEKKLAPHPFHGKLNGIDKAAKTISIGKSTYYITAETKIQKGGKAATLEDGVVGEQVGGYVKPGADGRMMASSITFGPKPETKTVKKTK
jgi:hypothetical protein